MNANYTIFIIDDVASARDSLRALVIANGFRSESFDSAEAFLEFLDAGAFPDRDGCIVTDVRMPGMSGLDLFRQIRSKNCQMPVIMVTGFADVPMAVQAIQMGASNFLEKPFRQDQLLESIDTARRKQLNQEQQRQEVAELQRRLETLTEGELQVMRKLVEGMPNKNIAKALEVAIRTVELRRSKIMKKMQAKSLSELVRMAVAIDFLPEHGLV